MRTPERYIELIGEAASTEAGSETLAPAARAEEAFALAIRLRDGVAIAPPAREVAGDLAAGGLLVADRLPEPAVLTRAGRFMASDITARLLLAHAAGGTHVAGAATAPKAPEPSGTRYH